MNRALLLAALLTLPAAVGSAAQKPDDVAPQPLRSQYAPPQPERLYASAQPDVREKPCPELTRDFFPRWEKGRLLPPAKYDLKQFDAHDLDLLALALGAAHRYADINTAVSDGYVLDSKYSAGMGIHMYHPVLVLSAAVEADKPQFLTYARSRQTSAYMLIQVGYIHRRRAEEGRYELFHSPSAHGHFHDDGGCVQVKDGAVVDVDGCGPGDTHVGPIWMMHAAVNFYNEEGLFADYFSCVDALSRSGKLRTFFGRPAPAAPAPRGSAATP
ncbi:MAG: hypothetical protein HY077_16630 [Elusimicrobia bacterium]|nr:hypothetical protein [Elusimicrobiota bacterium]